MGHWPCGGAMGDSVRQDGVPLAVGGRTVPHVEGTAKPLDEIRPQPLDKFSEQNARASCAQRDA